jgi:quinol monooxygenase YgiN
VYTSGTWNVKEGREDEFVRRWEEGAQVTSMSFPGVKLMLFRDAEDPHRFVSLAEGWRNREQIDAMRSTPQFQDSMAAIWRLLDSGEVSTLELAVEVS